MKAAVFSFTAQGAELSKKITVLLKAHGYTEVETATTVKCAAAATLPAFAPDYQTACERAFSTCTALIFVGAAAIAVRAVAPLLASKTTDPAVISIDEAANFVIPLLSGHIGGANALARQLAASLGAQACVTTATDLHGLFAVDEWAARRNLVIDSLAEAKIFAAALLAGQEVGFYSDFPVHGPLPAQVQRTDAAAVGMAVTLDKTLAPFATTLRLMPRIIHLGIGCRRNTSATAIAEVVLAELLQLRIDLRCVKSIASVDLKKAETGILTFASQYEIPLQFYSAAELACVPGAFTASDFVAGVVGVDNVCERSAVKASGGKLVLGKTARAGLGVTLAVAVETLTLDFTLGG